MTIERFANTCNRKIENVKKRIEEIKGAEYINGEWNIPEGSRWPYNKGNSKFRNQEDRIYAILTATDRYEYIDNEILGMSVVAFECLIQELLDAGLLRLNGNDNHYGANKYDVTMEFIDKKANEKRKTLYNISVYFGAACGEFAKHKG